MRHPNRNLDDFIAAVARYCVDTSYTNEYAAELLVKIAIEVYALEEHMKNDPHSKEAEG